VCVFWFKQFKSDDFNLIDKQFSEVRIDAFGVTAKNLQKEQKELVEQLLYR